MEFICFPIVQRTACLL